ncbi:MAG: hypothetical protein Q4B23_02145 [Helcococcus sp.]|nr:hypothetical protein [Helcococcus sp.]
MRILEHPKVIEYIDNIDTNEFYKLPFKIKDFDDLLKLKLLLKLKHKEFKDYKICDLNENTENIKDDIKFNYIFNEIDTELFFSSKVIF